MSSAGNRSHCSHGFIIHMDAVCTQDAAKSPEEHEFYFHRKENDHDKRHASLASSRDFVNDNNTIP